MSGRNRVVDSKMGMDRVPGGERGVPPFPYPLSPGGSRQPPEVGIVNGEIFLFESARRQ